jgi:hypothetical protein
MRGGRGHPGVLGASAGLRSQWGPLAETDRANLYHEDTDLMPPGRVLRLQPRPELIVYE